MKHTKEEILNALKVIKEECEANRDCDNCPLRCENEDMYSQCALITEPHNWELVEEETWRAFR